MYLSNNYNKMFKMLCDLALEFEEKVFGGGGLGGHKGFVGHCWSDLENGLFKYKTACITFF